MAPGICFPANEALLARSSAVAPTVTAAYRLTNAGTFMITPFSCLIASRPVYFHMN
jgi:hypothetical protein